MAATVDELTQAYRKRQQAAVQPSAPAPATAPPAAGPAGAARPRPMLGMQRGMGMPPFMQPQGMLANASSPDDLMRAYAMRQSGGYPFLAQ